MDIITGSLVVYRNNPIFLQAVIDSLPLENFKLVVVDNSPTNELRKLFSNNANIDYIFLSKNVGFGKAHNIAFDRVKEFSSYHFIINPDIFCFPSVFMDIVQFLEKDHTIGILGPKILYPNNDLQFSCRLLPTPLDLIIRRLPLSSLRHNHAYKNELRFSDYNSTMEVPFLLGCFLCVRSDVFRSINGFDEQFFMYLEDVDLCRKVNDSHKVLFYPEVVVYHHYAKESTKNIRLLMTHLKSAFLYFNKWGWIFDTQRKRINNLCASKLKVTHND